MAKKLLLESHQIMLGDYGTGNSVSDMEIDGLLTYLGEGKKFIKRAKGLINKIEASSG